MGHDAQDFAPDDVWVLCDTVTGHRRQALAVAAAVGGDFSTKTMDYGVLANLPNSLLGCSVSGLRDPVAIGITAPWPGLVIGAGRKTAPVARAIKQLSGGRTRLVQIMDPGAGRSDFDLIAVPIHDELAVPASDAGRIVRTRGAPHPINAKSLEDARASWREALEPLHAPRVAVFVGGGTRRRAFTDDMARTLAGHLKGLKQDLSGSLMITTSPRSGGAGATLLRELGDGADHVFDFASGDPNPYEGYIAWADRIVVTGDSVSMCSEVCAAGVPVEIFAPEALITPKHARFHQTLFEAGLAVPMGAAVASGRGSAVSAADEIADRIRAMQIGTRG